MKKPKRKHSNIAKDLKDIKLSKSLSRWFIVQTLILVGLSVLSSVIVQLSAQVSEANNLDAKNLAIIIIAWLFVLGFFELIQYRLTKRNLEKICDMIERLAHGDYGRKIKITRFNVFKSILNDVNLLSEELKDVQMLRNDFVNSYSHEFKTPIASINGFAQLLLNDETLDRETRKKYLKIIVDESTRLTRLAENTILLSQLDTQKIITDKKVYSLDEQLRRCVIMFSNEWMAKGITLKGDEIEGISYNGNEDLMQHLWLNLIHNAIKFTPPNGTINVSAKKKNGRIFVSIADSGIGMSTESAQRIFDKYYRDNTNNTSKGLGLGLSIAEKIVRLCNGRISVESELQVGSTFTVELPFN